MWSFCFDLNEQETENCRPSGIITFPDGESHKHFFFFLSFKIFSKSKLSHLCVCVCVCTFVRNPAHMQWLVYGRRLVRACLNDALASNRGLGQHKWNANALHSHQTSSSIFHSVSHGRRRKKETKTRMPCDDVMRGKKEKINCQNQTTTTTERINLRLVERLSGVNQLRFGFFFFFH